MRTFDAVIAGGGLIGCAIALELNRNGLEVAVFDGQEPGREASWASAGILSPAPESPAMIAMVPLGKASLALYPEFVGWVEDLSGISAGYRGKGTVEALFSRHARQELNTVIALHHGLGLRAEPLSAADAREIEPALSEDLEAAVLRPDEASVDNRLLTSALLGAATECGVQIFSGHPVEAIWCEGERCGGVSVRGEKTAARHTIIAAGCFSSQIRGVEQYAPTEPAKGQMVALRCAAARIERVLWSERIYLVPRNDGRILAGATVERVGFDKSVTAGGVSANLEAAIDLVPALAGAELTESWAGLRPDSPDHMPILGPTDLEGLVIATGHFRSGVLLTPITARLVGEYITEKTLSLDWERFNPMRFRTAREKTGTASAPGRERP
jgi:glycine oxidase